MADANPCAKFRDVVNTPLRVDIGATVDAFVRDRHLSRESSGGPEGEQKPKGWPCSDLDGLIDNRTEVGTPKDAANP